MWRRTSGHRKGTEPSLNRMLPESEKKATLRWVALSFWVRVVAIIQLAFFGTTKMPEKGEGAARLVSEFACWYTSSVTLLLACRSNS
jgi:hypothetical protein